MIENLVLFAALVLIAAVAGKANATTAMGAMIFFWARLAYAVIYLIGIPWLRTLAWFVSVIGMAMIAWVLAAGDVASSAWGAGRARPHRRDLQLDVDAARFLEHQGQRHLGILGERRLEPHEHDVKAAGLELDRGAGRDLDALFELAHAHDVAVHLHLMDLGLVGRRAFDGDQAVGRRAGVGDHQEAAA